MVDSRYHTRIVVDASPLIYLAKVEALEVFRTAAEGALVPSSVVTETTRPALLYRHPDAAVIDQAVADGLIHEAILDGSESATAEDLAMRVPGLHAGECAVLALAQHRRLPALLFERRAQKVAAASGIELVDMFELVFAGTADVDVLQTRIRRLAELVNMRISDYERLRERVEQRRLE